MTAYSLGAEFGEIAVRIWLKHFFDFVIADFDACVNQVELGVALMVSQLILIGKKRFYQILLENF